MKHNHPKIEIMDTTLRDGEQTSGVSFVPHEKLMIARLLLEELKVDRVEVASARVSEGEFDAVKMICDWAARRNLLPRVEVLGFVDGHTSVDWIHATGCRVINLLCKGSLKHCTYQLKKTPEEHIEDILSVVDYANEQDMVVNVYLEDWSNGMKDSPEYVFRLMDALEQTNIRRYMLPDTLGVLNPLQVIEFMRKMVKRYPHAQFDLHAHNDYDLAVSNVLAAVLSGCKGLHTTINGLGERAGNTAMEEVVMGIKMHGDELDACTEINTREFIKASRLVSSITGMNVQANKAIVGANAFAHSSGIHQDGVLKARDTYEIMRAEDVGWSANKIVLGKLSGRNAFKQRLQELGVQLDSETEINVAFAKFKELADRKSEIFDEDILALVSDESVSSEKERYGFVSLSQHSETGERPQARIVFTVAGKEVQGTSEGNGPVDASLKAIEAHVKSGAEMVLYSVNAISGSTESQGEVTVRLQSAGRVVNGVGADPDIVVASAKAYLSALNKLHSTAERVAAQG